MQNNKLILVRQGVLILVLTALVFGLSGCSLLGSSAEEGEDAAGPSVEATIPLEVFVVNLAGEQDHIYLRLGIALGVSEVHEGKEGGALPTGLLRDTIIAVLTGKTSEELLSAKGKKNLKRDLVRALQKRAPDLHVLEVYFTEFLVQR